MYARIRKVFILYYNLFPIHYVYTKTRNGMYNEAGLLKE